MLIHPYTLEKLIQLQAERAASVYQPAPRPRLSHGSGLLRSTGRAMQRAGEALESWAAPGGCPAGRREYSPQPKRY